MARGKQNDYGFFDDDLIRRINVEGDLECGKQIMLTAVNARIDAKPKSRLRVMFLIEHCENMMQLRTGALNVKLAAEGFGTSELNRQLYRMGFKE